MTRLLGFLICLFIGAAVFMSTTVAKRQDVLREVTFHNDSWAISQTVSEFMRLEANLASYALPMENTSIDEVRLRLDIFISRLVSFEEGSLKRFLADLPFRREVVSEMIAIINDLDQNLETMERPEILDLMRRMQALNGPLTQLSSQSVKQSWQDVGRNLESLERLQLIYSLVVAFLILCWGMLVLLVVRHNRLLKQTQKRAETLNNNLSTAGQELRDKNRRLEYLAHYDSLTKLPNRVLFWEELESALKNSRHDRSTVNLLLLDLDDFKTINDTMGHDLGDMLLEQASARMVQFGSEAHMFCRLGGDEFACLLIGKTAQEAKEFARDLVTKIGQPYQISNREVRIGCSVGLANADQPSCDEAQLLFKRADIGLYRAKASPQERICLFVGYMQDEFDDRQALEHDLRRAVERDEFKLVYQEQVHMRTLKLRGVEALVRWNHPTRGEIQPGSFIPIAEELGLIVDLGSIILRHACREATTWKQPLTIAVNLSPIQLQAPGLVETVLEILNETGLDPTRLELEITESTLLSNHYEALEVLTRLRNLGIKIAIDDFGTGYSSLAILREIPFDTIKLDKAFIRDIAANRDAEAMITLVIDVGLRLGKTVIIEGVETEAQHGCIRRIGGDVCQGFLFARPVEASKLKFHRYIDAETKVHEQVFSKYLEFLDS